MLSLIQAHKRLVKRVPSLKKMFEFYVKHGKREFMNRLSQSEMVTEFNDLAVELGYKSIRGVNAPELHTLLCGYVAHVCNNAGCNHTVNYDVNKREFNYCCSKRCASESGIQKERREKTMVERYGVPNPYQSPEIRKKISKVNLERYGTENPSGTPEVREKIRNTNRAKYGADHPMKTEQGKAKQTASLLAKYGVTNPMHMQASRDKLRETNLKLYGTEFPSQLPEVQRKAKETYIKTCMERYGVANAIQDPVVRMRQMEASKLSSKLTICGKTLTVQGYEPFAFQALFDLKPFVNISNDPKHTKYVDYKSDGKQRRYFPDAIVRMSDGTCRVLEVKSWFTLTDELNTAKLAAATKFYNEKNIDFILVIIDLYTGAMTLVKNPSKKDAHNIVLAAQSIMNCRTTW